MFTRDLLDRLSENNLIKKRYFRRELLLSYRSYAFTVYAIGIWRSTSGLVDIVRIRRNTFRIHTRYPALLVDMNTLLDTCYISYIMRTYFPNKNVPSYSWLKELYTTKVILLNEGNSEIPTRYDFHIHLNFFGQYIYWL